MLDLELTLSLYLVFHKKMSTLKFKFDEGLNMKSLERVRTMFGTYLGLELE